MSADRIAPPPAFRAAACAILALSLVMPVTAVAQPARTGASFERLDRNGDGAIDAAEVAILRERTFARLDANGDGVLTREEHAAGGARLIARRDADGDGTLTREELRRR
jgi:Ca2+-binding EF-hand superfamily protein